MAKGAEQLPYALTKKSTLHQEEQGEEEVPAKIQMEDLQVVLGRIETIVARMASGYLENLQLSASQVEEGVLGLATTLHIGAKPVLEEEQMVMPTTIRVVVILFQMQKAPAVAEALQCLLVLK